MPEGGGKSDFKVKSRKGHPDLVKTFDGEGPKLVRIH